MADQYLMLKDRNTGNIEICKLKKDWYKDVIATPGGENIQTKIKTSGVGFSEILLHGPFDGAKRWVNKKDSSHYYEIVIEESKIKKDDGNGSNSVLNKIKRSDNSMLIIEKFLNFRDQEALYNAEKTQQKNKDLEEKLKEKNKKIEDLESDLEQKEEDILKIKQENYQKYREKLAGFYDKVIEAFADMEELADGIILETGVNIKKPMEKYRDHLQEINILQKKLEAEAQEQDEDEDEEDEEPIEPTIEEEEKEEEQNVAEG